MVAGDLRPDRAVELVAGVAEKNQRLAGFGAEPGRDAALHVVDDAEHTDDRGRQDRRRPGLVVEADVAAGDRNAKCRTTIGEPADGLAELPHDAGVLGRAEVEAVGDRDRRGAGDRDVAVRLGQRELRTRVRVESGVPARRVGRDRDAPAGRLVDAQHSAVGVLGQDGVAADVAVVLLGDERTAAQVRTAQQRKQSRTQFVTGRGPWQFRGRVGVQRVLAVGALHRPFVHRALVRDGARWHVDDGLTVPGDHEPVAVGDLTDDGGQHLPLAAHRHERVDVLRRDDSAHALLRLAGQDLRRHHVRRTQRHGVQLDPHAAVARRREFGCGAGQPGTAEVLDADDEILGIQLEAALDEHLLHERVAHLHRGQLLAPGRTALVAAERVRRQHRHAADAVESGARAEQDDLVARARRERQVQILLAQYSRRRAR